jgi:hypothetical protein
LEAEASPVLTERNVQRIERLIGPADERGCELWRGATKEGYPILQIGRWWRTVHRLWFEHERGRIRRGHHVHHICKRPACMDFMHMVMLPAAEHRLLHRLVDRLREEGVIGPR